MPELVEVEPGHYSRCFFYHKLEEAQKILKAGEGA